MKIASYYITESLIYIIAEGETLTLPNTEHNRKFCKEEVSLQLSEIDEYLQLGKRLRQDEDLWSKAETLYGYIASIDQVRHLKNIRYLATHLQRAKEELDITYSQVIRINDLVIDATIPDSNVLGLPPDMANEMAMTLKKNFRASRKMRR